MSTFQFESMSDAQLRQAWWRLKVTLDAIEMEMAKRENPEAHPKEAAR